METSLYRPVKCFLERLGFTVEGEIGGCDVKDRKVLTTGLSIRARCFSEC